MSRDSYFVLLENPSGKFSWRGLLYLLGLYVGAHLIAAVISPPVFGFVQHWAATSPNKLNVYLAGKDFPAYFDRFRMLPILIGLPILFRVCGLWSWRAIGYGAEGAVGQFLPGFGVGVLMIAPILALQLAIGRLGWAPGLTEMALLRGIANGLLASILLALIEELVFRGFVFRLFYSAMPAVIAVLAAAAFFAYVHFGMPDRVWDAVPNRPASVSSGFFCAVNDLRGVFLEFKPGLFLTLFLVGLLLNLLFLRARSLWPCAGLHAGWVFVNLMQRRFLRPRADVGGFWLGPQYIENSPLALLIVGVAVALVWVSWRRAKTRPA